jgi:acetamidase/formamidase
LTSASVHGLAREQGYILPSVPSLAVGRVVDVPSCTVSATIELEVFEEGSA